MISYIIFIGHVVDYCILKINKNINQLSGFYVKN